jgi:MFS family permease
MFAAFFVLSVTVGGAIGNLVAGVLIEARGFGAFGWVAMALSVATILVVLRFLAPLHDQVDEGTALRAFWSNALGISRRPQVRRLIGLRALPTIFYGMLSVLIPLLLNDLTGSKVLIAAYGTTTLIVASAAQLVAGRAADRWGARPPTLAGYAGLTLAGLGLSVTVGTVGGLFVFGVLGNAAAWALAALMYVWVADGVPKDDHPSTFGLLHAVWSLSMIVGSLFGGWFVQTAPGLPFLVAGLLNVGALFLSGAYYRRVAEA